MGALGLLSEQTGSFKCPEHLQPGSLHSGVKYKGMPPEHVVQVHLPVI